MGRSKKGGLTGIAKFLSQPEHTPMTSTSTPAAPTTTNDAPDNSEDPPVKRRKLTEGTEVAVHANTNSNSKWIQNYDATGTVPHYTSITQVPLHLQKYFHQRYRYFSLYSEPPGCLLDEEGWYSVTPELIANQIAERCRCDTILDAFCGVGGNAIAFAQTCERVIALDTSPTRLALARHNAQIYGVADRIEFILTDYITFAESYIAKRSKDSDRASSNVGRVIDVVFLSPPWGGPSYLSGLGGGETMSTSTSASTVAVKNTPEATSTEEEHPEYSLASIQPIPGDKLFNLTRRITKNVAYYLPRNTNLQEISDLLTKEDPPTSEETKKKSGKRERVEVEEEWTGNKLKALTCYFGGLAEGQEYLFDLQS